MGKTSLGPNAITPISNLILTAILGLVALVTILPMILVVMVSFSSESAVLRNGFSFFPKQFSPEAYKFLFAMGYQLLCSYWITIRVTVLGTLLSLTIISFYAYAISRRDFKYRNFFTFFVVIPVQSRPSPRHPRTPEWR